MISIDQAKCSACGICGTVCPRHVLVTERKPDQKVTRVAEERLDVCMGCGQCVAVCPNDALAIDGLAAEAFKPVPPLELSYDSLLSFISRRRSVRRYQDKPVEREALRQIALAAGMAPAGAGRAATGVIIIDHKEQLARLSSHIFKIYEDMQKALGNPIGRMVVKRKAGPKNYEMLNGFVMPGMRWYIHWKNQGQGDEILRDCQALMLFHTAESEPVGKENCVVAAWHAIFAAETLGVGTCMNDLIPPACKRSPQIQEILGLPDNQEVMASLTLGYPKFEYRKTIPRELTALSFLE